MGVGEEELEEALGRSRAGGSSGAGGGSGGGGGGSGSGGTGGGTGSGGTGEGAESGGGGGRDSRVALYEFSDPLVQVSLDSVPSLLLNLQIKHTLGPSIMSFVESIYPWRRDTGVSFVLGRLSYGSRRPGTEAGFAVV